MTGHATLTDEQGDAAYAADGPLLVLAGPGSGKTRTLVARILHFVRDRSVPPASVLALAFGTRAADELRARLASHLGEGRTPDVTTVHAFGLRIVRRWPERLGYRPPVRVCTNDERHALAVAAAEAIAAPTADPVPLLAALDRYRLGLTPGDDALEALASAFEDRLRRANWVDYPAMLLLPLRIVADGGPVSRLLQRAYRCVLVDEVQDLSHVHYRLVQALGAAHRNVTLAGDPLQQLYAWRGADGEAIHRFASDFAGARVVPLRQNFRSTGAIVAVANALARPFPGGWNLWTANAAGEPPVVAVAADERAEARFVAGQTRRLLDTGDVSRPAEVAILVRTRSQAPGLAAALRDQGLPSTMSRDGEAGRDVSGTVRLLTVHAAKGGEWPVVFVTGLEEGLLPHAHALQERGTDGLDDERRVAYVAVTRPQRRIILTCCRARKADASPARRDTARRPSRFLLEVLDAGIPVAMRP